MEDASAASPTYGAKGSNMQPLSGNGGKTSLIPRNQEFPNAADHKRVNDIGQSPITSDTKQQSEQTSIQVEMTDQESVK